MAEKVVYSSKELMNNEWMDLDTTVIVPKAENCDDFGPNVVKDPIPDRTVEKLNRVWTRSLDECQLGKEKCMPRHMGGIYSGDESFFAPYLDEYAEMHVEKASSHSYQESFELRAMKDNVRRFTYRTPKPGMAHSLASISEEGRHMANMLINRCPESRELENAIDAIDMAVMWAVAAIVRSS